MSTEEKVNKTAKEGNLVYEVGFLLLPTLPEEKMPEIMANIKGIIEKVVVRLSPKKLQKCDHLLMKCLS